MLTSRQDALSERMKSGTERLSGNWNSSSADTMLAQLGDLKPWGRSQTPYPKSTVVHACNPSSWEAKSRSCQVPRQQGLHMRTSRWEPAPSTGGHRRLEVQINLQVSGSPLSCLRANTCSVYYSSVIRNRSWSSGGPETGCPAARLGLECSDSKQGI